VTDPAITPSESRALSGPLRVIGGIDRMLGYFEKLFLYLSCAGLAIMLTINIANLVVRNFAGRGIIWVWPWTGTLLIWSVFLAFFVLYRRRLDITVEYFLDRMTPAWRRGSRILVDICGIIMMGLIVIEAPQIMARQIGIMDFIWLERYVLSLPLIASAGLILIDMVIDIFRIALTPVVPPPSTQAELPRWSL
jgi:TRAP-type C4-dicarboxylate transport system permease small subunit